MKIIDKYLHKYIFYTMLMVTVVTAFILLCNQLLRYLDYVATGKFPLNILFRLVLLELPILFALLLPLGLFIGILLSYGKLYTNSEMTVLFSCGFSKKQLITSTLKFTTLILIIVSVLGLWLNPKLNQYRDKMLAIASSTSVLQSITAGKFQIAKDSNKVYYVEKTSDDNKKLQNFFVAQSSNTTTDNSPKNWTVMSAESGSFKTNKKNHQQFLVAENGYRYSGIAGQLNYQIAKFATNSFRITPVAIDENSNNINALNTSYLIKNIDANLGYMAELQWRLSLPIMTIILALFAIPLSQTQPRQGRFIKFLPAILLYILYANMIFISRDWLSNAVIPAYIGVWWVHAVALISALMLLGKANYSHRKK